MSDANGNDGRLDLQARWLFDPDYYCSQFALRHGRGFEVAHYGDAYDHFLTTGQFEDLSGHPLYDPAVYRALASYDIACRIAQDGPFTTFLRHSLVPGLTPVSSNLFDPAWYLRRYPAAAGQIASGLWMCALHHYLANTTPTDFDPTPNFSERGYLAEHGDVDDAVNRRQLRNGYSHFLAYGRGEGRRFFPAGETAAPATIPGIPALRDYPLYLKSFYDVTLLPSSRDGLGKHGYSFGVLDRAGSPIQAFAHPWFTMRERDGTPASEMRTFIYGGVLMNHFGHVLRDSLSNLWYIYERPDLPVLWHWIDLPVPHTPWPGWLEQLWRMTGLDQREHIYVKAPISVAELILPQSGLVAPDLLHERQIEALAMRANSSGAIPGMRVWLSRRQLPPQFGRLVGEEILEAALEARGWQIMSPESLQVEGQVDLHAHAEVVAGFMSSAFHAALLSKSPRAELLLVVRPGIDKSFYNAVARAKGLRQHYIMPALQPYSNVNAWTTFSLSDPISLANQICAKAGKSL